MASEALAARARPNAASTRSQTRTLAGECGASRRTSISLRPMHRTSPDRNMPSPRHVRRALARRFLLSRLSFLARRLLRCKSNRSQWVCTSPRTGPLACSSASCSYQSPPPNRPLPTHWCPMMEAVGEARKGRGSRAFPWPLLPEPPGSSSRTGPPPSPGRGARQCWRHWPRAVRCGPRLRRTWW